MDMPRKKGLEVPAGLAGRWLSSYGVAVHGGRRRLPGRPRSGPVEKPATGSALS